MHMRERQKSHQGVLVPQTAPGTNRNSSQAMTEE
jgi:hypothetical protein